MRHEVFSLVSPRGHGPTGGRPDLRYLRYLPSGGAPPEGWPLILFLHGAAERGDDLELLLSLGLPKHVEQHEDFRFAILSPQCPAGSSWYRQTPALTTLLRHAVATLPVDARRVYLTGLSMGGYGTWHLAARHPELFAAIAPICGGGLRSYGFPEKVRALRDLPVWCFHGALDTVVLPEESQRLIDELRAHGGHVKLTLYPDVAHDSWTRTYANPALYEWLLSHRRPVAEGLRPPRGGARGGPARRGSRR